MPTTSPGPDSRKERSRQTRERLLDATIESLIEVGYARTSMQELCTRADVSRGAQLHHYPTKAKLMAAAIEHLYAKQLQEVVRLAGRLRDHEDRVDAIVDLITRGFAGPFAQASIELWTAARTDPELLASLDPIERDLARRTLDSARTLLGPELDEERLQNLFWLTVSISRGLAIDEILQGSAKRRKATIDAWRDVARASFG